MPEIADDPQSATPHGEFAHRLDLLRQANGDLSVYAFAKFCGVADTAMRNYLAGRGVPGFENLDAISKATGVSLEWLVRGDGIGTAVLDVYLLEQIAALQLRALFRGILDDYHVDRLSGNFALAIAKFYSLATIGGPRGKMTIAQITESVDTMQKLMDAHSENLQLLRHQSAK